ncbi:MAG: hypothetical protein IK002_08110 [Treponema sp.]|uniref:tetratricopeptide repeat protein n=1 Tax=Treponema sp. TaxID=166 RepID=UPI00298DFABB|nr:hypothetical protein [Treponema sp.]MBR5933931.1 hypothetical protein [Treponema sp.]
MKKILLVLLGVFFITGCKNKTRAEEFYLEAAKAYKEKNFANAENLIEKTLLYDRNNFQAEFLKGKILFFQKNYAASEKIFSKLTEKKHENIDVKLWLLRSLIFNDELEKAEVLIKKISECNNNDWRIFYWKAQIAKKKGDFETYFLCLNTADSYIREASKVYLDLAIIWNELGLQDRSNFYYEKEKVLNK